MDWLLQIIKGLGLAPEVEKTLTDKLTPAVNDQLKQSVDRETTGLKTNNQQLLDEKKKLQERIAALGDLADPEKLKQLRDLEKMIQGNEEMQLIKDGKIDEVFNRRSAALRQSHEAEVKALKKAAEEASEKLKGVTSKFKSERLNSSVAQVLQSLKTGKLADGALPDVQRLALDIFDVDDEGKIVARDSAPVWNKGRITFEEFGDYLVEHKPYFFGASSGGGAGGSRKPGDRQPQEIDARDKGAFLKNLDKIAKGEIVARMPD
jgi:hypothetical protein